MTKIYKCTKCSWTFLESGPRCMHQTDNRNQTVIADTDDRQRIAELEKENKRLDRLATYMGCRIYAKDKASGAHDRIAELEQQIAAMTAERLKLAEFIDYNGYLKNCGTPDEIYNLVKNAQDEHIQQSRKELENE